MNLFLSPSALLVIILNSNKILQREYHVAIDFECGACYFLTIALLQEEQCKTFCFRANQFGTTPRFWVVVFFLNKRERTFRKQEKLQRRPTCKSLPVDKPYMLHSAETLLIVLAIKEICNYTWNLSWSQVVLNKTWLLLVVNWQSVNLWLPVYDQR